MSTFPPLFRGLVDDAAIFPPGNAPLDVAVGQHAGYRDSTFAELVGPFVVSAAALTRLAAEVDEQSFPGRLDVVAVAAPQQIEQVVAQIAASRGLALAALDVRLAEDVDPTDEIAGVIAHVIALGDRLTAPVYIELPRPGSNPSAAWLASVRTTASAGHRLKFRLGGTVSEAFPSERELAEEIRAAVAAMIPFKCTAGLHRAVRHRDPATGFEHHGYLNVLVATSAAAGGASSEELTTLLSSHDGPDLAARLRTLSLDDATVARTYFTSYGSCSITEPLTDLVSLGLIDTDYLEMT